jgi:hypothetical protein
MAKTRLTNELRKAIAKKAVEPAFKAREEAFEVEKTKFADAIYQDLHGAAAEVVRKLPPEWSNMSNDFSLHCRGDRVWGHGNTFTMSKDQPFPPDDGGVYVPADHPWALKEMRRLGKVSDKLHADKEEAYKAVNALMYSCRTVEALLEAWPEGEAFIPTAFTPTYPVAVIGLGDKINRMLGIGPVTEAGKAISKARG